MLIRLFRWRFLAPPSASFSASGAHSGPDFCTSLLQPQPNALVRPTAHILLTHRQKLRHRRSRARAFSALSYFAIDAVFQRRYNLNVLSALT